MFGKSKEKDVVEVEETGAREAEVKRLCELPVLASIHRSDRGDGVVGV